MAGIQDLDYYDDDELLELLRQVDLEEMLKASFGGDRSAAGRYAAEQRWKGHVKREDKGGEGKTLRDATAEVSALLRQINGMLEYPISDKGSAGNPMTPEEYEASSSKSFRFVYVKTGRSGKVMLVPSKKSMEAERRVNELGRQAFKEVGARLVADGTITQKELDDAIAFQRAPEDEDDSPDADLYRRAMAGDESLGKEVADKGRRVAEAKEAASKAKGALMKATREYNKHLETEGGRSYDATARQLWEARKQARAANIDARLELANADEALMEAIRDIRPVDYKAQGEAREAGKANSLRVQGLIGAEVKRLLAGDNAMSDSHPANKVDVPQMTTEFRPSDGGKATVKSGDQVVAEIMGEVSRRFPKRLLDLVAEVRHKFTSRGGGHYNDGMNLIQSDMDDADTLTHETVHAISYRDNATRVLEQAALSRRVFGKPDQPDDSFAKKLEKVGATKAVGWRMGGKYIEDKFVAGYQGRMYGLERSSSGSKPTEILTIATENLFGGGHWFRNSGRLDQDLMMTALGWLLVGGSNRD
ncbi:MAG: hypothetical protein EBT75_00175 [Proteobacteria bacterium]|nr:hypothetical protein [Pseudomonadota bacterium]